VPGPPPKPTALKILQGNPGRRPLPVGEPTPPAGAQPPDYVKADPVLLVEWHRNATRLTRLGLLTEIDDEALAMMCVLNLRLRAVVLASSDPGNQAGAILGTSSIIDLSKELRMLWARFGMTPADRARVKVEKPKPESKLERFTSGAKG
jgi:phage terminase small subunit